LLKQTLAEHGGRGGGSAELAQGGLPGTHNVEQLETLLRQTAARL
jgi:alanyl-tRNA synthetase